MDNFLYGFVDELAKVAEADPPATVGLGAFGGLLGALVGLIASKKGRRLVATAKGGGVGGVLGGGLGLLVDSAEAGEDIGGGVQRPPFYRAPNEKVWI